MKTIHNLEVFHALEKWAPRHLAYDWDHVGLQIGSVNERTKKIMVTLDVLEPVVDEAIEKGVNLIISHHPILFKSINQINTSTPKGRTIQKLMQHHISVYTAHTNLDIAKGGVNDLLANQLEIETFGSLVDLGYEKQYKVVVYVPTSHVEEICEAFHQGGAGQIGNYSHCTFQTAGQGTFKPLPGSDPFIGSEHEVAHVDEVKIESIVPERNLSSVISEIKQAHPYEEVAYDAYLLQNEGESYGLGRIGELKEKMTLNELCDHVKRAFDLSVLKVTGTLDKQVKKVAILGGSGEKFIFDAMKKDVDVYITGDVTFHLAQEAMERGLAVIDAGHYIEKIMKQATKTYLEKILTTSPLQVICSNVNTNPFQYK